MSARGFSLIELLVACALVAIIGAAVASLVAPLGAVLERTETTGQLEPAGRTVLEDVLADIREGGSDPAVGRPERALARVVARAVSLRGLGSDEFARPGAAVRVIRVPHLAAQGLLSAGVAGGDFVLPLDTVVRCAGGPPACGFLPGDAALLYNGATAQRVTIEDIGDAFVRLRAPLPTPFAAGAVLAEVVSNTYGTRATADGSRQLVRISTNGAEQPLLDNVSEFEILPDAIDPFRVRSIAIRLRLEAASPELRGPAGYLFRRAGTSTNPRRWVPDVELRARVALRNPVSAP